VNRSAKRLPQNKSRRAVRRRADGRILAERREADMSELPEVSEFVDLPTEIDTSQPHIARMYDYYLGGKNHFAADRQLADKVIAAIPGMRTGPRENREFLGRAVRSLAAEAGIRQFLDIGTGLPTTNSVHEVAQQAAPSSRVVYVDNDRCKSGCAHVRRLFCSARCPARSATVRVLKRTRLGQTHVSAGRVPWSRELR
jgi:S-adenosyl methyltransferase